MTLNRRKKKVTQITNIYEFVRLLHEQDLADGLYQFKDYFIYISKNNKIPNRRTIHHHKNSDKINERKRTKYKELKEKGLCGRCGKQRNDKKYAMCERCRMMKRVSMYNVQNRIYKDEI